MSPTRGSISCGVTVVTEVMKDMAQKTAKFLVTQRPIQRVAVKATSQRTKGRRLRRSPSGQRKRRPAA
jgi:hypothetical protein